MDKCPKCENKIGFIFGTCNRCGFNCLDKTYHWIRVHPEDILDSVLRRQLTMIHESSIKEMI